MTSKISCDFPANGVLEMQRLEDMDLGTTITTTLSILEEAPAYNRWVFEKIRPWLGETILEVGCGTGNLTGFFLGKGKVISSDINEGYLQIVRDKYKGHPNLKEILIWDIQEMEPFCSASRAGTKEGFGPNSHPDGQSYERGERGWQHRQRSLSKTPIDTIVCSNVLEHVEDDDSILKNFYQLLPTGGRLIVLVPALKVLYNVLDRDLGHFRRYGRGELTKKLQSNGFKVCQSKFFNLFGIFGWFVNGTLLKRRLLPVRQVRVFDKMVPFFICMERIIPTFLGQSLIITGEKGKQLNKVD